MRQWLRLVASASLAIGVVSAEARADVTKPFPGITVVEHPGSSAMVIADLCTAGVSARATRYGERKATPQQWAEPLDVVAAVNADFFDFPGWTLVNGRARGAGEDWPADKQNFERRTYWQFGPRLAELVMDADIAPLAAATEIVGGHNTLIKDGVSQGPGFDGDSVITTAHRRTAIGLDRDRRFLYLLSLNYNADGNGLVDALVALAAEGGAPKIDFATNMDGGGSSQLYVKGKGQIITSGRQVNNHLGVFARGSGAAPNCIPKYAGDFVGQSFPPSGDPPLKITVDVEYVGWIDLKNVGTATWTSATHLAPMPRDSTSPLGGKPTWLSDNRVSAVEKDTPPGAVGRFPVKLLARAPGETLMKFGVVQDGVTWFADLPLGAGPPDDFLAIRVLAEVKPDAGPTDAGADASRDSGAGADASFDAAIDPDAARDDAGDASSDDVSGSCGCRVAPRRRSDEWVAIGLVFGLAVIRRARASRRRRTRVPWRA